MAALRCDGIEAPGVFDGPINSARFLAYVEQCAVQTLRPGDIVVGCCPSQGRDACWQPYPASRREGEGVSAALLEERAERRTVTARTAAGTAAFARPTPTPSHIAWLLCGGSAGT